VVLLGCAVRTKVRNEDWKTDSLFWRRTLAASPDSPFAHNSMGVTYQREGRYEEAIAEYYKALELKPNLLPAYNNLAIIYRTMDRKADAINIYLKILEMNPKFLEMYNNLGALYSELGNYAEAEKYYKTAIERDPLYGYAYYNLGRLYEEMGRKKEAEEMIAKAFQVYPRLRYELSQSDPALMPVPMKETVPASVPVIEKKTKKKAKGKVPAQKQMPAEAEQSPGAYHNSLGIKFIMNNQPQEAVKEFQKAVELDPENADAFNNLGNSLNAVGRSKEAIDAYSKAIDINPGSAVAHFNLCVSYFDARQFDLAVQHCDIAAQFGYKVPPELLQQLKPYRKTGDAPLGAPPAPRKSLKTR
jgi:superkiller protein 3